MPIYEYKCKQDGEHITDGWNNVDERHDSPICDECGDETFLILSATRSNPDIQAFQSLGFDHGGMERDAIKARNPTHFRSRRHFNEELKARGLAVADSKQRSEKQRDFMKAQRNFKENLGVTSEWIDRT